MRTSLLSIKYLVGVMDKVEQEIKIRKENALAIFKVAMLFIFPLTVIGVYFKKDIILLINQSLKVNIGYGDLSLIYVLLCLIAIKIVLRKNTIK